MVNPAANMQELRLWGCLSTDRELVPAAPDPSVPPLTVSGALIEPDIRRHIQQGLVLGYAEALDSTVAPAQVLWLRLRSDA